nr:hypothetical protein [Candidatus Anoxychlamydiales bacterium]
GIIAFCIDEMELSLEKNPLAVLKVIEIIKNSDSFEKFYKRHTLLTYAAMHGHNLIVKALLDLGIKTYIPDEKMGKTALIHATIGGFIDIVETLLSNRADPNTTDRFELGALFYAKMLGFKDIENLLLKNKAKIITSNEYTSLVLALQNNEIKISNTLLAYDFEFKSFQIAHLLGLSISNRMIKKDISIPKILFKKYGNQLIQEDKNQLLLQAIDANYLKIVKILLDLRASSETEIEASVETEEDGLIFVSPIKASPAAWAVCKNNVEALKMMISEGFNIEVEDSDNNTLLNKAAQLNNIEAIKALLASKANIKTKNHDGLIPLKNALKNNSLEAAKILLEAEKR